MSKKNTKETETENTNLEEAKKQLAKEVKELAELLDIKADSPEYTQLKMSVGMRHVSGSKDVADFVEGYKDAYAAHRFWHTPGRTASDVAQHIMSSALGIGLGFGAVKLISMATSGTEDTTVETENDVYSNPSVTDFKPLKAAK